jgi:hypothetical protein
LIQALRFGQIPTNIIDCLDAARLRPSRAIIWSNPERIFFPSIRETVQSTSHKFLEIACRKSDDPAKTPVAYLPFDNHLPVTEYDPTRCKTKSTKEEEQNVAEDPPQSVAELGQLWIL